MVLSALTRRVPGEGGKNSFEVAEPREVIRVLGRRAAAAAAAVQQSEIVRGIFICKLGGSRSNVKPAGPILPFIRVTI